MVPLRVVTAPQGQTLAFVAVIIVGEGPFQFALDTGASASVVDSDIAQRLRLPVVSRDQPVTGVATRSTADVVRVDRWELGGVPLPNALIATLDLPSAPRGQGFDGLLGSDQLARFGRITLDYDRQQLVLPPE